MTAIFQVWTTVQQDKVAERHTPCAGVWLLAAFFTALCATNEWLAAGLHEMVKRWP